MVVLTKENFSIRQICESGQCFRLEKLEGQEEIYGLTAFGRHLVIRQKDNEISFDCPADEYENLWKGYFDLEEDYGAIIRSIDERDIYLQKAAAFGNGIRILKQDLWEMIISFIVSQQNNIKRIRKCIDLLCRRYGEKKETADGSIFFDFPTPKALSGASLEELYACNLGYRSRYVRETAICVLNGGVDLDAVRVMGYKEAKTELMKLCGVGIKVAECVCLFALHKTEAFPVDTHINKVMKEQYPEGFPFQRYRGYEGTLQQYIFYYDLTGGREFEKNYH